MTPKFFYSTLSAAKELGISRRTVERMTERLGITPLMFESRGARRHFWSRHHLAEIRKHLRAA